MPGRGPSFAASERRDRLACAAARKATYEALRPGYEHVRDPGALGRAAEPTPLGVPPLERAATGRMGRAAGTGMVAEVGRGGRWRTRGVAGFEAATQLWPGVASRSLALRFRAQLGEVRVKRAVPCDQ